VTQWRYSTNVVPVSDIERFYHELGNQSGWRMAMDVGRPCGIKIVGNTPVAFALSMDTQQGTYWIWITYKGIGKPSYECQSAVTW
jgi:hypothetical protein